MSDTQDCDCCAGVRSATPGSEDNPAGQGALRFRVGTHARFLASQHAALAAQPALERLTTRAADDPAMALLDSWSGVLDVLSFYQERIANEGYLRTATERRSVLELARAIGYELRPGVAASTSLAFTLEDAPGAPPVVRIAAGVRAQSVPIQDQQAQVFETLEAIDGRPEWNAIPVVHEEPAPLARGSVTLYLRGQHTRLQPGDALLVVGDERRSDPGNDNWDLRRVARLLAVPPEQPSADPLAGYTVVTLDRPLGANAPASEPAQKDPRCYLLRAKASLFGSNAPDWRVMPQSLRAAYLGFDDEKQALISVYREWPGFTLAELSDPPSGSAPGTGLYGEYFAGKNFEQRRFSRTDAAIDFEWGVGSPDPRLAPDLFSVRWTGWLQAPQEGEYTLFLTLDDGARLWIDGTLVVDWWQDGVGERSGKVTLAAGMHDVRLDYFENLGGATCKLSWQGPGFARQLVPSARLYPREVRGVQLDAGYPAWVPGSWVVLGVPGQKELYQVASAGEDARARFTLSSKTTRLTLQGERLREVFNERLRDTTVLGESVEAPWAPRPLAGLLRGHVLELAATGLGLAEGRALALSGKVLRAESANRAVQERLERGDELAVIELARDGNSAALAFTDGQRYTAALDTRSEVARIRRLDSLDGTTRLQLEADLAWAYLPLTVRVNANVAPASHGDSKQMQVQPEVLGSGDSSRPYQRFELRQWPLTHIAAPTPSGTASTLQVSVAGVRWHQAQHLGELGPADRSYLLRTGDDGRTTVQFGDGEHGARLPSGQMNVEATYRVGIGSAGNLAPGQISLLLTRPLGLKDVINPTAASGGADPESGERARRNAPLTVRTLDRIVSLRDFEDFAAAYAGIGKAQAVWLWNGEARLVHLSVSGIDGAAIDLSSALYRNLAAAIDAVRPAHQPLVLAAGTVLWVGLEAKVALLPDVQPQPVLAALGRALQQAFGFAARQFGQALSGSEVLAVMQSVAGVDWVDLDALFERATRGGPVEIAVSGPDGRLGARRARWQDQRIAPAELLVLDPGDLQITTVAP
jgi:hypothetical protein